MASLSLGEAAEKTGTSKVDIWRAIREGALPAQKTNDGGFVIETTELFRVFKPQPLEHPPEEKDHPPEDLRQPAAAPLEAAATNDIAVAFAALGAELRGLLAQGARGAAKGLDD